MQVWSVKRGVWSFVYAFPLYMRKRMDERKLHSPPSKLPTVYSSRRPSMAFARVTSSAYSKSLPTGTP